MRSMTRLLVLAASFVLVGSTAVLADPKDDYHPLDLKAQEPPGPNVAVDGTGDHVVLPGTVLDQSALDDPDAVKWPTLDKSVWEQLKDSYVIETK
jgi:hypothetical protein